MLSVRPEVGARCCTAAGAHRLQATEIAHQRRVARRDEPGDEGTQPGGVLRTARRFACQAVKNPTPFGLSLEEAGVDQKLQMAADPRLALT